VICGVWLRRRVCGVEGITDGYSFFLFFFQPGRIGSLYIIYMFGGGGLYFSVCPFAFFHVEGAEEEEEAEVD
jgi:hypothetical protein